MTELHAVSDLQQRYGLASHQAVYDQIAALNIKQVSRGKLSTEQLDKLDRLDKWLKANPHSAIADFPQEPEVMTPELSIISHQSSANDLSSGAVDKLSFIRSHSSMPATVESGLSAVGERSEGRSGKPIKFQNSAEGAVQALGR